MISMRLTSSTPYLFPEEVEELFLQLFPFRADLGAFGVVAPLPEAYFVHKLIVCQRRRETGKQERDLEQCATIARKIDD